MCQPVYDKGISIFLFMVRSTGIKVPGGKITQTTLSCGKKKFPLKFLSLETVNVLKARILKVTLYIRKRNGVLAQLSSSFFSLSVGEEQKTLKWEVFGFASLISWTTQSVLAWIFRVFQLMEQHSSCVVLWDRWTSVTVLHYWKVKSVLCLEIQLLLPAFFCISVYIFGVPPSQSLV